MKKSSIFKNQFHKFRHNLLILIWRPNFWVAVSPFHPLSLLSRVVVNFIKQLHWVFLRHALTVKEWSINTLEMLPRCVSCVPSQVSSYFDFDNRYLFFYITITYLLKIIEWNTLKNLYKEFLFLLLDSFTDFVFKETSFDD